MNIFCQKHADCETSIKVIAHILANNDPFKYDKILKEFNKMKFNQVKDLARTTLGKASTISLDGDPIAKLYNALQIYDKSFDGKMQSAELEYQKGNFIKTRELCNELICHQPSNLNPKILLAASCIKCKDYDNALDILNKILILHPNCAEALNNIGSIYWEKSELNLAISFYLKAVSKKKNYIDGWINCSEALVEAGDTERAIASYSMLLTYQPELYKVRTNFGNLLLSLNQSNEADFQFITVKHYAPDFAENWNNLGVLYFNNDKIEYAINHYKKALEFNSNLLTSWINLGNAYLKLENYQTAIDTFKNALNLFPDNIIVLKELSFAFLYQNNVESAIDYLKKYLELKPNDFDCNLELGLIYYKYSKNSQESAKNKTESIKSKHLNAINNQEIGMDNYKEAAKYLQKCLEINPTNINVHEILILIYKMQDDYKRAFDISMKLGDIYFEQKDQEKAKMTYMCALHFDDENAVCQWKLGLVMHVSGCLNSALSRYRKAIELKPNFPDAYCDTALAYKTNGFPQKAIEYYKMAIQLQPSHLNSLHNLALLYEELDKYEDCMKTYDTILKYNESDKCDVHINMANIYYKKLGNLRKAHFHYGQAVELDGTYLDVHLSMGNLLRELNNNEVALECFNKAIALDDDCVIAYTNIGSIHKDSENYIEAIQAYKIALKIQPDFSDAYCNLVQCLQYICDWSDYDDHITKLKDIVSSQFDDNVVPSLLPHHSLLYPFPLETLKKIAVMHAEQCIEKSPLWRKHQPYIYQTSLSSKGCIRIGYVTSDFEDHSSSQLMQLIPYWRSRNEIEIFCYSLTTNDRSKISTRIDNFLDISKLSVVEAADQMNIDGIHILVNMIGYTKGAHNEIFALKPAPVQVLWLGYPGTTGASFIDYLITDKTCSPPELKNGYTEKLVYMKRTVFIGGHQQVFGDLKPRVINQNQPTVSMNNGKLGVYENGPNVLSNNTPYMYSVQLLQDQSVKCFTRTMYNIPEDVIVYCYFGQLYKLRPSTLQLWADILENVPNSVLWLLRFPTIGENNVRSFATKLNIDSSRLIFSEVVPKDEHMRRMQLADIFLDTPICNSRTTCLDALWSGTPVVTLPGETYASRVAASQLTTLGRPDLIAQNEKEYVQIATKLGLDCDFLNKCRLDIWSLREKSQLFDCKSYALELEMIYKDIWNSFCQKNNLNVKIC